MNDDVVNNHSSMMGLSEKFQRVSIKDIISARFVTTVCVVTRPYIQ